MDRLQKCAFDIKYNFRVSYKGLKNVNTEYFTCSGRSCSQIKRITISDRDDSWITWLLYKTESS
jgi:hypothetical protein